LHVIYLDRYKGLDFDSFGDLICADIRIWL